MKNIIILVILFSISAFANTKFLGSYEGVSNNNSCFLTISKLKNESKDMIIRVQFPEAILEKKDFSFSLGCKIFQNKVKQYYVEANNLIDNPYFDSIYIEKLILVLKSIDKIEEITVIAEEEITTGNIENKKEIGVCTGLQKMN